MLVLSRKTEESIEIQHCGESITIQVVRCYGSKVSLGFEGPKSFRVIRSELPPKEVPVFVPTDYTDENGLDCFVIDRFGGQQRTVKATVLRAYRSDAGKLYDVQLTGGESGPRWRGLPERDVTLVTAQSREPDDIEPQKKSENSAQ